MKKGIYDENGVKLSKQSAKIGDKVELIYNGLLKNSGATEVKAHIGYNEGWDEIQTLDMELKDDAFTVNLTLTNSGTLKCAFVDPLGNWDNNSGENYSFKVAKTTQAKKASVAKKEPATKKTPTAKKAPATKKTSTAKEVTEEEKPAVSKKAKTASDLQAAEIKKAKKEAAPSKKTGSTKQVSADKKASKPAKEKK